MAAYIDDTMHHQPMDVDNDDVERFFPGHYPLPVRRYHAAQADQDTIEREFIPDITFGIATIDLNPFDQREHSVEVPTTPPVFLFPSTNLFTAQETYNASSTATYYTDNTANGQGNAFGQHDSGTTRGAWTTQQGFQGVGDTPWYITGTSSAIAQSGVASQTNGLGNAYAVAEDGQSALTPPATSWSSGAQVTTRHNIHSNATQQATYSQSSARAIPRPASDGNVGTSNNGSTGTATNGAGLPPMTLLPGAAEPPRNPEWAVLVWPRSLMDQASRWMYATENHIRQTAMQLAAAISRAEGIAIGEARAAEALAAERTSWSAGYEVGQREARDGEETAIAEAVEEERARQRELLEQIMARTRTEAYARGTETTRRAADEQLAQQQRTIDDLNQHFTRATQDSGTAHRQMETIIAQQRARIEQTEHDAATARAQAEQTERRRFEQAQVAEQRRSELAQEAEQRRLEHAQEMQELRAQRDTAEEQRREQALDADVVQMELETALQASAGQAQTITDLERDLGTAQNAERAQRTRNETLEQERASLQAQIAALRQERDDLQAELAQERAGRQLARQPGTGNIPGLDQDANMEAQEPPAIAASVLDDAALREALIYQGDVFERNRAEIIQAMRITVRQVLVEGGGVLQHEDFDVIAERREFSHPITGDDRIRNFLRAIGLDRVRNAVREDGFQDEILVNLMGGSRFAPPAAPVQQARPFTRPPAGSGVLHGLRTEQALAAGSFYDEMENGDVPAQGSGGSLGPDAQEMALPDQTSTPALVPNPTVTPFALDGAKLHSLMRHVGTLTAPQQRRQRAPRPIRDESLMNMTDLAAALPDFVARSERARAPLPPPARARSPSPLREVTDEEIARQNAQLNVPEADHGLVHRIYLQNRDERQHNRNRRVFDGGNGTRRDAHRGAGRE